MFFGRGTFWALPLTYFIIPKVTGRTFFPNRSKFATFAAAPSVLTPFVRNQLRRMPPFEKGMLVVWDGDERSVSEDLPGSLRVRFGTLFLFSLLNIRRQRVFQAFVATCTDRNCRACCRLDDGSTVDSPYLRRSSMA